MIAKLFSPPPPSNLLMLPTPLKRSSKSELIHNLFYLIVYIMLYWLVIHSSCDSSNFIYISGPMKQLAMNNIFAKLVFLLHQYTY